jgi:hypothetical protein
MPTTDTLERFIVIRGIFRFEWLDGTVTQMEEIAWQRWEGERRGNVLLRPGAVAAEAGAGLARAGHHPRLCPGRSIATSDFANPSFS